MNIDEVQTDDSSYKKKKQKSSDGRTWRVQEKRNRNQNAMNGTVNQNKNIIKKMPVYLH